MEEAIRKKVEEAYTSDEVKERIMKKFEDGKKRLFDNVNKQHELEDIELQIKQLSVQCLSVYAEEAEVRIAVDAAARHRQTEASRPRSKSGSRKRREEKRREEKGRGEGAS